jgi:N-methylhydantoinase A
VITVATNHLASAIRMVSIEKGFDPRDFALFAFGGAGPLHATALAMELGVPRVLVPRFPGATSALGCILADLRHDYVQTVNLPLAEADGAAMDAILAEQAARGKAVIAAERVPVEGIAVVHEADLLFRGQSHVFRMPVAAPGFDPAAVMADFAARYKARFDIELAEMRAQLVNLRTCVLGLRPKLGMALFAPPGAAGDAGPRAHRPVHFGGRPHETPIWRREHLPADRVLQGPLIVEQMDATTVVDPGARLEVDRLGNLIVSVGG